MNRAFLLTIAALASATIGFAETTPESAPPKHERPPLTDEQRAQLEEKTNNDWNALSLPEKAQLLKFHRALRQLPREERKFIQDRLEQFMHMSPEEQQRLRENSKRWRQMTPDQREKARELYKQRRQQFEDKWRRDHPGEEPPPFLSHGKATTPPAKDAATAPSNTTPPATPAPSPAAPASQP